MKAWGARLKRDALTVWLAPRDPGVPLVAKAVAGLTAAYAFSPVDLIPDFIPVLGLVDDLIIVPAGVWLALRLVPPDVTVRLRVEAAKLAEKPVSKTGLVMVVAAWGLLALLVWRWFSAS